MSCCIYFSLASYSSLAIEAREDVLVAVELKLLRAEGLLLRGDYLLQVRELLGSGGDEEIEIVGEFASAC